MGKHAWHGGMSKPMVAYAPVHTGFEKSIKRVEAGLLNGRKSNTALPISARCSKSFAEIRDILTGEEKAADTLQ